MTEDIISISAGVRIIALCVCVCSCVCLCIGVGAGMKGPMQMSVEAKSDFLGTCFVCSF